MQSGGRKCLARDRLTTVMRREAEHFGEQELGLLYVAQKLKHALRLEQLLTDAGIDYLVESDEYSVGLLFRRGLAFESEDRSTGSVTR